MAAKEKLIDCSMLPDLLDYDPGTGVMRWRERPLGMFKSERDCKIWNTRFAGKKAFASDVNGYKRGSILGVSCRAHQVVWAIAHGEWPKGDIDHINGNPADNRISNLRDVPHDENMRNQRRRKTNSSGVMGVSWNKRLGKWTSRIVVGGKTHHLGTFASFNDAVAARAGAEKSHGFHPNHGGIAA